MCFINQHTVNTENLNRHSEAHDTHILTRHLKKKTRLSELIEIAQGGNIQYTSKCAAFGNMKTDDLSAMFQKT
jgi:hypothetical protein